MINFLLIGLIVLISHSGHSSPINLNSQNCPAGWTNSQSVPNKCYLLVNTGALPDVANTNCSQLASGGSLVSIDSGFENKEIFDLASNNKNKCAFTNIWIGLHYSNNLWGWTNGDQSAFRKWDSSAGYPKMLDLQQCASMEVNPDGTSNPSFWMNEDCYNMECYLCQVLLN